MERLLSNLMLNADIFFSSWLATQHHRSPLVLWRRKSWANKGITQDDDYELCIRSCTTVHIPNTLRLRPYIAGIPGSVLRSYFSVCLRADTIVNEGKRLCSESINDLRTRKSYTTRWSTVVILSQVFGRIFTCTIVYERAASTWVSLLSQESVFLATAQCVERIKNR